MKVTFTNIPQAPQMPTLELFKTAEFATELTLPNHPKQKPIGRRRKKGKHRGCQLPLFQFRETTETEKLIFYFWDSVKKRNVSQLYLATKKMQQWLSPEQFDEVMEEIKGFLTMDDKAWFVVISAEYNPSILSLLFVSHAERCALLSGNLTLAAIIVLFVSRVLTRDYHG